MKQVFIELAEVLSLMQSWSPVFSEALLGSTWFISTILFLYLITPLLIHLIKKVSQKGKSVFVWILGGLFVILYIFGALLNNKLTGGNRFWIYTFPLARVPEYFLGMILGMFLPSEGVKEKKSVMQTVLLDVCFLLIGGVILFLSFKAPIPDWVSRALVWMIPNLLILLLCSRNEGFICRILSLKPLVKLGSLGLYMYLLHPVIFVYTTYFNAFWDSKRIYRILCFFMILILTVCISVLLEKAEKFVTSSFNKHKLKGTE